MVNIKELNWCYSQDVSLTVPALTWQLAWDAELYRQIILSSKLIDYCDILLDYRCSFSEFGN